jgi:hypothetical protein
VVAQIPDGDDILIVELLDHQLDEASGTLIYDVRVLEAYEEEGLRSLAERQADSELAESFGPVSLFIDGDPCPCVLARCFRPDCR